MVMKSLAIALICLSSLACSAQEIAYASVKPLALYEDINLSLSRDNVKDALATFKGLIAFYKSTHQYDQLPESYFGMALALAFNGNYKESIRYHKLAIRAHKKLNKQEAVEMNINLGLTYKLAGKEKKAQRILGDFRLGT